MTATVTTDEIEWTTEAPTLAVYLFANPAGYTEVRVIAETPAARAELLGIRSTGHTVARTELAAVRDTFFRLGEGANFLGMIQRVKDAETAAVDAEKDVLRLRDKLDAVIGDDDGPAIEKAEKALAAATVNAARLAARVPVLKAQRDRFRPTVEAALQQELREALTTLTVSTEEAERDARAALTRHLDGPFRARLKARAEGEGIAEVGPLRLVEKLARID